MSSRKEFHQQESEKNESCAKAHNDIAASHRTMMKAAEGDDDSVTHHEACAAGHQQLADAFTKSAKFHAGMAKSVEASWQGGNPRERKAMSAEDLAKIAPDGVAGIPMSDVPGYGARAILRPGQPELVNGTDVPVELQHFLKIED